MTIQRLREQPKWVRVISSTYRPKSDDRQNMTCRV